LVYFFSYKINRASNGYDVSARAGGPGSFPIMVLSFFAQTYGGLSVYDTETMRNLNPPVRYQRPSAGWLG
jgi:hypothetical protein